MSSNQTLSNNDNTSMPSQSEENVSSHVSIDDFNDRMSSTPSESELNPSSRVPIDDLKYIADLAASRLTHTGGLGFSFTKNVATLAAARSHNMPALSVHTFGDDSDSDFL